MSTILKTSLRLLGGRLQRSLDKSSRNPEGAQKHLLSTILRRNKASEFGRLHGFAGIRKVTQYQTNVPIQSYKDMEPAINRMIKGEKNVLMADSPVMFNLTSGTTANPKYIPVTKHARNHAAGCFQQWLYRALRDHPSFLDRSSLSITSAAVEGRTPSGIPYGSLSGLIYRNLPRPIRRSYVLPYLVADIKDYDLRYYVMARLALAADVSFVVTPNPTTLAKIAVTAAKKGEEIVRSVNDGHIYTRAYGALCDGDRDIIKNLNTMLRPAPRKSSALSEIIDECGKLVPHKCWPSLRLIGCWLGGSVGYHAQQLPPMFGKTPTRDIGYLASEGCFTVPFRDNTPAGLLALDNAFYEFIPEGSRQQGAAQPLMSHQLETDKTYRMLVTNASGLYRYDMCDIVKVDELRGQSPVLSFLRKSDDFLNITGEKVHVNQLATTLKKMQAQCGLRVTQFRAVANVARQRHDLFLAVAPYPDRETVKEVLIAAIDRTLRGINIEYAQKRESNRLHPPCIHIMDVNWEEEVKKAAMQRGKRDVQYKWRTVASKPLDIDKEHIISTTELENG